MATVPCGKFGFIHQTTYEGCLAYARKFFMVAALCLGVVVFKDCFQQEDLYPDYKQTAFMFHTWEHRRDNYREKFHSLLKKHPELEAKYGRKMTQKLLNHFEVSNPFEALAKISTPFSPRCSHPSFLIKQKKFAEALHESLQLQQMLDQEDELYDDPKCLLYADNLLRICFLHQQLSHKDQERSSWHEFKRYMRWVSEENWPTHIDDVSYRTLMQHFQKEDISLKDYVLYREAILS
ncbi:MAG: hypothetical protein QRY72_04735 [Candidatus Rhabdochlamydia sp.]